MTIVGAHSIAYVVSTICFRSLFRHGIVSKTKGVVLVSTNLGWGKCVYCVTLSRCIELILSDGVWWLFAGIDVERLGSQYEYKMISAHSHISLCFVYGMFFNQGDFTTQSCYISVFVVWWGREEVVFDVRKMDSKTSMHAVWQPTCDKIIASNKCTHKSFHIGGSHILLCTPTELWHIRPNPHFTRTCYQRNYKSSLPTQAPSSVS